MNKKIRVLIVDDSDSVRQILYSIMNSDPLIEVCGMAGGPHEAVKKISEEVPDVISLDIQMPRMDGLTFLKKIMAQHPIPVVIISSLTDPGSSLAMMAYRYGALEILHKPKMDSAQAIKESGIMICDAIKAAASSCYSIHRKSLPRVPELKNSADVVLKKMPPQTVSINSEKIIVIGASTGGTEIIANLLKSLPVHAPGIVIAQHMPEVFTQLFANRVDQESSLSVKEAQTGDIVKKGTAFIAPGNKHLLIKRKVNQYILEVVDGPLVNRHRPAVAVLFRSAAQCAGSNASGILLTGMGNDGAECLLEMKENGAYTIAQDKESCVVFGMPARAIELNAVCSIWNPEKIAAYIRTLNSK